MSGFAQESGKTLGATTAVSGSTMVLSQGPLKTLAGVVLVTALVGAVFTVLTWLLRRILVRK
jgi:Flp pilus assembly protein protease CpaA